MRRKEYIKGLSLTAVLYVAVGIAVGLAAAWTIALEEYQDVSQIIGSLSDTHPEVADELIRAIKQPAAGDYALGNTVLTKYNYSQGTFFRRHAAVMIGFSLLLLLIPAVILSGTWFLQYKKQKKRINGLTFYLEAVNLGHETRLLRQEDDFSFLEDEIYKTVTELRQTRENALREKQSLADNLADISHQLKTPLTSMSLMTQFLAENSGGEGAVYVERLDRQLMRFEKLVTSLLTLSKLDAGTLAIEKKPVYVNALLIRAIEPIEDQLRRKHQQLVIRPEGELSFNVDPAWTAEALLNIVKNCSEHTPEGGAITICFAQNPLYTEIVVEDSGTGFEKDDIPHLFERFYKGKNASKDSVGIGLALSKSIINNQNGIIRAENIPEGGARFVIKFYA